MNNQIPDPNIGTPDTAEPAYTAPQEPAAYTAQQPAFQQPVYVYPQYQQPFSPPQQYVYTQPAQPQQNAVYPQNVPVYPIVQPTVGAQQPYMYMPQYTAAPEYDGNTLKSAKKKGIASFILGLVSLISEFFGLILVFALDYSIDFFIIAVYLLSPAASITGIVLGARSKKALRKGNGLGTAGFILSVISTAAVGAVIGLFLLLMLFLVLMYRT